MTPPAPPPPPPPPPQGGNHRPRTPRAVSLNESFSANGHLKFSVDEARLERLRQLERGFENTKAYFEKMDFSESCMKHAKRLTEISSALVIKEGETSSRSSSLSESSTGGNMRYMEPKELAESENTEKEGVMTKFERNDHGGEVGAADLDSENGGFESKIDSNMSENVNKADTGIAINAKYSSAEHAVKNMDIVQKSTVDGPMVDDTKTPENGTAVAGNSAGTAEVRGSRSGNSNIKMRNGSKIDCSKDTISSGPDTVNVQVMDKIEDFKDPKCILQKRGKVSTPKEETNNSSHSPTEIVHVEANSVFGPVEAAQKNHPAKTLGDTAGILPPATYTTTKSEILNQAVLPYTVDISIPEADTGLSNFNLERHTTGTISLAVNTNIETPTDIQFINLPSNHSKGLAITPKEDEADNLKVEEEINSEVRILKTYIYSCSPAAAPRTRQLSPSPANSVYFDDIPAGPMIQEIARHQSFIDDGARKYGIMRSMSALIETATAYESDVEENREEEENCVVSGVTGIESVKLDTKDWEGEVETLANRDGEEIAVRGDEHGEVDKKVRDKKASGYFKKVNGKMVNFGRICKTVGRTVAKKVLGKCRK